MKKKHYLVYKTTNLVNGKIYIGKHETDNLDDGYLGSGKLLKFAIQKYGEENFKREILFECSTREEMNSKEAELVNEEFLKRDDVYNIKLGGEGGFDFINSNESDYGKGSQKRHHAMIKANRNRDLESQMTKIKDFWDKTKAMSDIFSKFKRNVSNGLRNYKQTHPDWMVGENNPMYGKTHTRETKDHLSKLKTGNGNPMCGKIWIFNIVLKQSKIWDKSIPIPDGWEKGRCSDKKINNQKKKQEKLKLRIKKLQLIREMFLEFKKNEFGGVVKKFGYNHTRNALIMMFKKYIPEYVPQECNRWKNRNK